ncbi:hypothetical protein K1719_021441 [Acacia pycnantha]|nr:hypothetical protein K1719_021441 [Acacia pycnantha]
MPCFVELQIRKLVELYPQKLVADLPLRMLDSLDQKLIDLDLQKFVEDLLDAKEVVRLVNVQVEEYWKSKSKYFKIW